MELYEAILKRKSVRHFKDKSVPKEVLSDIMEYAKNIDSLDDTIGMNIEIVESSKKRHGAPCHAVLYSEEKEGYLQNAGYVMEYLMMYLVSMGLGTCYRMHVGNVAKRDAVGRGSVISIAFGYADEEEFRNPLEASRLTQKEICFLKEEPNANIYKLIEAVRMSPSAYNLQPWRLVVYKNSLHFFVTRAKLSKNQKLTEIDTGVALANIDMAADSQWIDIIKKKVPSMEQKGRPRLEYLFSLKNVLDNMME